MISFSYTAKSLENGRMVKAEVMAESEGAAAKLLMAQQLFPISIVAKERAGLSQQLSAFSRVSAKDRVIFTRQLSTLINAGLPLVQSLRTVRAQLSSKPLQEILDKVVSSVEGGQNLSVSLAAHPKVFNQVYISLVAAGESSGTLDETLERVANQQEKDAQIVGKIRGAMIYPLIVMLVIIAVLVFMLTTVLPQVGKLYSDLHKALPPLTQALLFISNFIVHFWWLTIILVAAAGFGIKNYINTDSGKTVADSLKLNMPVLGRIFKKVYMARYARTLGTLMRSGVPMLQSLDVVKNAVNNRLIAGSISRSISEVKGGKSLSESIEHDTNFLILVPQMISIGEKSGAIDDLLNKVATFYENEVDEEIKTISTTIEPLLMVVLGVTVGLVIAAILLPVYSLVGTGGVSGLK